MSRVSRYAIVFGAALLMLSLTVVNAQSDAAADLPPDAKPGECYARVMIPAVYETSTENVMKKEASERIEVIPARFEWVEERVQVREAATKIEVVPARYEWVEEKVMIKPASSSLQQVPAKYEWAEEKILVKPAQTVWKKGRGPIEKVDNGTGEIMCLVEEPAVYETVRKRVLVSEAKTTRGEIPAEYQTVKKQRLVEPATTRELTIPAAYETVKVRKLVSPPEEKRFEVPAEYGTVTKRKQVSDSRLVWKPVLCQTNISGSVVTDLQRALKRSGHDPGPIDGVVGHQTLQAVNAFQKAKGMASGGLTMETLRALNVRVN